MDQMLQNIVHNYEFYILKKFGYKVFPLMKAALLPSNHLGRKGLLCNWKNNIYNK